MDDIMESFLARAQSEIDVGEVSGETPGQWAANVPIQLDRGPFTFKRHEYLREPYNDQHPCQVEMKCTQMGNTVRALLRVLHLALFVPHTVGAMYLFPSKTGSGDFSRSRVSPLVEANPKALGRYLRDTDSVGLKRVKGKNIIFRGTKSAEGLRSDPVDMVVYDEYDLFPEGVEAAARERMAHSDLKWEHYLSNPTLPDKGIDAQFQRSDQRYWMLKCPKCGEYTCLEDHVDTTGKEPPSCLVDWDGQVVRLCMACRDAVLDPAKGQWVARKPSITERRGYHYSQLWSQFVPPADILDQFHTTRNLQYFFNYKLGLPYVEAENRLSVEQVLALCGSQGIESADPGPCTMGVDQGRDLHVVIGRRHPDRIIHAAIYKDWAELEGLMANFNISLAVVDAMPETRSARAFAEKFPGRVYLNYYSRAQKGDAVWSEDKATVSVNRTEAMDLAHQELQSGSLRLPKRCKIVEEYAAHAHNVAKQLEETPDGGTRYVYVKLGPDHFRHAQTYETLARTRLGGSFFGEGDLR